MGSEDGRWQVQLLELGLSLWKSGSQEGWEVHHLLRSVIKLESLVVYWSIFEIKL